jgi:hypothetical protein
MGNGQSLQVSKPRQPIIINIISDYANLKNMKCKSIKDKPKKLARFLDEPIPTYDKSKPIVKNKHTSVMATAVLLEPIHQYPSIGINRNLLVARCGNFMDEASCLSFASSLKTIITNRTAKGASLFMNFGNDTLLTCRFLKILITNDDRFYLIPLQDTTSRTGKNEEWVEESFTRDFIMGEIGRVGPNSSVFSNILLMIKRQKQLINPNGSFIFCVEFKLNTLHGIVFNDSFHQDDDLFRDSDVTADYLSITNTSQSRKYGYSTEIRAINDNESYVMITRPGDTTLITNKLVQHRVPKINPINVARYVEPDKNGFFDDHVFHKSNLAVIDQKTLETNSTINEINESLKDNEPRHIIRMLISELQRQRDLTGLPEITDLVTSLTFISPIVKYEGTVFDRNPDAEDIKTMVKLLKDFSIGGKSKKKRRKRKGKIGTKKKLVRKNYSSGQRGGSGDLSDLKYLNEYFAIYADPETACLIENNIEVII